MDIFSFVVVCLCVHISCFKLIEKATCFLKLGSLSKIFVKVLFGSTFYIYGFANITLQPFYTVFGVIYNFNSVQWCVFHTQKK